MQALVFAARRIGPTARAGRARDLRGTEHILLALLEVEDGTGVLAGLGVDRTTTEANIAAALADELPCTPTLDATSMRHLAQVLSR